MSRAGAHAGRLHPEEQFVFAMVFALMAGFVVVITMSAVRSSVNSLLASRAAAASSPTIPAGTGGTTDRAPSATDGHAIQAASPRLNVSLAAAIGPVLRAHPGQLAVGVIDETTGRQALYAPTQRFRSGSIVTADILAALLIRHEHAGTPVTSDQAVLASAMLDYGSATAATALWRDIGGGNGLSAANRLLKLRHTIPGPGDSWERTTTTVSDQLQLLVDLTSGQSPLRLAGRDYMMRMLGGSGSQPGWGAFAVGNGSVAQAGWLLGGTQWATNSVGIVEHRGHVLLVVILSSGSASQGAGTSLASGAAVAAADVMVRPGH